MNQAEVLRMFVLIFHNGFTVHDGVKGLGCHETTPTTRSPQSGGLSVGLPRCLEFKSSDPTTTSRTWHGTDSVQCDTQGTESDPGHPRQRKSAPQARSAETEGWPIHIRCTRSPQHPSRRWEPGSLSGYLFQGRPNSPLQEIRITLCQLLHSRLPRRANNLVLVFLPNVMKRILVNSGEVEDRRFRNRDSSKAPQTTHTVLRNLAHQQHHTWEGGAGGGLGWVSGRGFWVQGWFFRVGFSEG